MSMREMHTHTAQTPETRTETYRLTAKMQICHSVRGTRGDAKTSYKHVHDAQNHQKSRQAIFYDQRATAGYPGPVTTYPEAGLAELINTIINCIDLSYKRRPTASNPSQVMPRTQVYHPRDIRANPWYISQSAKRRSRRLRALDNWRSDSSTGSDNSAGHRDLGEEPGHSESEHSHEDSFRPQPEQRTAEATVQTDCIVSQKSVPAKVPITHSFTQTSSELPPEFPAVISVATQTPQQASTTSQPTQVHLQLTTAATQTELHNTITTECQTEAVEKQQLFGKATQTAPKYSTETAVDCSLVSTEILDYLCTTAPHPGPPCTNRLELLVDVSRWWVNVQIGLLPNAEFPFNLPAIEATENWAEQWGPWELDEDSTAEKLSFYMYLPKTSVAQCVETAAKCCCQDWYERPLNGEFHLELWSVHRGNPIQLQQIMSMTCSHH